MTHPDHPATIGRMLAKASQSPWLAAGIVSAITLAVFWPVLSADFVMWDDNRMVLENPNLKGLSLDHIGWIFTHVDSTRRYTPLAALTRNITYQLGGLRPFGYHFSGWLFHGINAALVFLALRMLLLYGLSRHGRANVPPGLITAAASAGALVWSLHPLRVESVAWVGANFYSQAAFFSLLSLLCYLRTGATYADSRSRSLSYIASVSLFVAALLSHPIAIGFLVVPVIIDVYPLARIGPKWWRFSQQRRMLFEKIPFAAAALGVAVVTTVIRLTHGAIAEEVVSLAEFGLFDRLMQAMYIWAHYLWRPFWPIDLSPVYTRLWEFDPYSPPFVISAATAIAMAALAASLRRRWPLGLALVVCYLVLLVPVLGVFEHPHYANDRYSLMVSVLLSVLVAALLAGPRMATWLRNTALVASAVVIAGLGALAFHQTRIWHDSVTLFGHMISVLGEDPYAADPHSRLGRFLLAQSRIDEAISHFDQAIVIRPDHAEARNGRGVAYREIGRWQEAIDDLSLAIRIRPDYASAHYNRALTYGRLGRWQEAIQDFSIAIAIQPDDAESYNNRGAAYGMLGYRQEATADFSQAVRMRPDYAEARRNLGKAFIAQDRLDEALDQFRAALALRPDWPACMNNMAFLIAAGPGIKNRDTDEAIRLASRACELTGHRDPSFLDTLAIAYASAGRFSEAVDTAQRAIDLADTMGQPQTRNIIQHHLSFYTQGRPYIEAAQESGTDSGRP